MPEIPTLKQSFLQKVESKLEELSTLKINTSVGDKSIKSSINMIDGDITTTIHPVYIEDEKYSEIKKFHFEREAMGDKIIKGNIETIKELISLADMLTDKLK